jgi:hypothetical protein
MEKERQSLAVREESEGDRLLHCQKSLPEIQSEGSEVAFRLWNGVQRKPCRASRP